MTDNYRTVSVRTIDNKDKQDKLEAVTTDMDNYHDHVMEFAV